MPEPRVRVPAPLRRYGHVLALPGAAAFSLTGAIARLPASMVGLGVVVLLQPITGSYGTAASVSAAYLVAQASGALVVARLTDRLGQRRLLAATGATYAAALALLVVAVLAGLPQPVWFVAAVAAGLSAPQAGSAVRARWAHLLSGRDPGELHTAFSLEAVVDEAVFLVGPVLVTTLAVALHPAAGLVTALTACLLATQALAAQHATEPPVHVLDASAPRSSLRWRVMAPVALVSLGLGVLFGAAEVATVAFADDRDQRGYAGVVLGVWALGSLLAGVVVGALHLRSPLVRRLRVGVLLLATAMVPLTLAGSLPVLAGLMLVGGAAISPSLVALVSLVEATAPRGRLNEAMAVVQTGLTAGVAPGAVAAGFVVDHVNASASFWVSVGAGLLAVAGAWLLPRDAAPTSPPGDPTNRIGASPRLEG